MGHWFVVEGLGRGTVRIGRWVVLEIGGLDLGFGWFWFWLFGFVVVVGVCAVAVVIVEEGEGEGDWAVFAGVPRETEFLVVDMVSLGLITFCWRPEMIGGGRSRPSVALRESCLAKSEACHHSRNLSRKIDVGRASFNPEKTFGKIILLTI